ncbi:hypothetical protein G6F65_021244 [Rhizopus arrhizus]|nr:hypothetical protein G6F65_021244 [Rhizopus arrhizus]
MKRKVSLFTVLIAFAVLSVAIGFFNALYAGYQVQRAQVVKNSLAANLAYAEKLAEFINLYIDAVHQQLKTSARRLSDAGATTRALSAELTRVAAQAQGVSAVLLADAGGTIVARSDQIPAQLSAVNTLAELGVKEQRSADWVVPPCLA